MAKQVGWSPLLFLAALSASACSDSSGGIRKGPCTNAELASCGRACSFKNPCATGLYCNGNGLCSADCTEATVKRDCASGELCSSDGHCAAKPGVTSDANSSTAQDAGMMMSTAEDDGGAVCAQVKLDAMPRTPNVILLVDQSASMSDNAFGSSTRWDALKASLLGNQGLIAELQNVVRFGLVLYSSKPDVATCPMLTEVDVALGNLEKIRAVVQPAQTIKDTPTGESVEATIKWAQDHNLVGGAEPTVFILATDGSPDTCAKHDAENQADQDAADKLSVDAVKHAFSLGIRTYVIAVAQENEIPQAHVQALASAGVDMPNAKSYRVTDDQGLREALRGIVLGQLSCDVALKGRVTAQDPCVGSVTLGGQPLACNDPNGWKLLPDSTTIRLLGGACDKLKGGSSLRATFRCGDAVLE